MLSGACASVRSDFAAAARRHCGHAIDLGAGCRAGIGQALGVDGIAVEVVARSAFEGAGLAQAAIDACFECRAPFGGCHVDIAIGHADFDHLFSGGRGGDGGKGNEGKNIAHGKTPK